jgi:hypothetical protein
MRTMTAVMTRKMSIMSMPTFLYVLRERILATRPAAVTNAQATFAQNARNPGYPAITKAIILRRSSHFAAFSVMRGRETAMQVSAVL